MTTAQGAASGATTGAGVATTIGTVAGGGSAAAGLAFLAGPVGIAIVAVAAILAGLGATKGKTQHLTFDEARNVALKFAEDLGHRMEADYGDAVSLQIGKELARRMVTYLEGHYLNTQSSSWQYWIGNCIDDLRNRAEGRSKSDITSVIYLYATYIALNYDASRPAEFAEFISHDLTLFFQSMNETFPQWKLDAYLWPKAGVTPAAKQNESILQQTLGIDTGSLGAVNPPKSTATVPASSTSASGQSATQSVWPALLILGGIVAYAAKAGK